MRVPMKDVKPGMFVTITEPRSPYYSNWSTCEFQPGMVGRVGSVDVPYITYDYRDRKRSATFCTVLFYMEHIPYNDTYLKAPSYGSPWVVDVDYLHMKIRGFSTDLPTFPVSSYDPTPIPMNPYVVDPVDQWAGPGNEVETYNEYRERKNLPNMFEAFYRGDSLVGWQQALVNNPKCLELHPWADFNVSKSLRSVYLYAEDESQFTPLARSILKRLCGGYGEVNAEKSTPSVWQLRNRWCKQQNRKVTGNGNR